MLGFSAPTAGHAKLLKLWHIRLLRATTNYRKAADDFRQRDAKLTKINSAAGIAVLFFSSASIAFDKIEAFGYHFDDKKLALVVAGAGALVLFTSMYQLIMSYGTRAVMAEQLATDYGGLGRQMEFAMTNGKPRIDDLKRMKLHIDSLAQRGQVVSCDWNNSTEAEELQRRISALEAEMFS